MEEYDVCGQQQSANACNSIIWYKLSNNDSIKNNQKIKSNKQPTRIKKILISSISSIHNQTNENAIILLAQLTLCCSIGNLEFGT